MVHESSSPVVSSENCYFLLPLQVYLPQFGPLVACRFFMAWKIRKGSTESGMVKDYFGIYKEIFAANVNAVIVIPTYLAYAQSCLSGYIKEAFPAEFILMIFPCLGALIFLVIPSTKIMFSKCDAACPIRHRTVPLQAYSTDDWDSKLDQNEILDLAMTSMDQSMLPSKRILADILHDQHESKLFRDHAQKALCAENVDFYLEIVSFNTMAQTFGKSCSASNIATNALPV